MCMCISWFSFQKLLSLIRIINFFFSSSTFHLFSNIGKNMAKHRGYVSKLAIYNYPEICQAFIFKKMGLLYSVEISSVDHTQYASIVAYTWALVMTVKIAVFIGSLVVSLEVLHSFTNWTHSVITPNIFATVQILYWIISMICVYQIGLCWSCREGRKPLFTWIFLPLVHKPQFPCGIFTTRQTQKK